MSAAAVLPEGETPPGRPEAILLDAGGVLVFPDPDLVLPPLRAAGTVPTPAELMRAHYRAMAVNDTPGRRPPPGRWWFEYLRDYVAACGVPQSRVEPVAEQIEQATRGFSWTHVGPDVPAALRDLAALEVPLGIVSNATGEVEHWLRELDVCYAPDGRCDAAPCAGVRVGVVIDSAVVGVSKPDPAIFRIALDALGLPAAGGRSVVHVGDSLRYDVAGAVAAGLRPVHLDPHGYCPEPAGHDHVRRLADLPVFLDGGAASG